MKAPVAELCFSDVLFDYLNLSFILRQANRLDAGLIESHLAAAYFVKFRPFVKAICH